VSTTLAAANEGIREGGEKESEEKGIMKGYEALEH